MPLAAAMAALAVLTSSARLVGAAPLTVALALALWAATVAIPAPTIAALLGLRGAGRSLLAARLSSCRWGRRPIRTATAFAPPVAPAVTITLALALRSAIDGPVLTTMAAPRSPYLDQNLFGRCR